MTDMAVSAEGSDHGKPKPPPPEERVGPEWESLPGKCNSVKRQPPWGLCRRPAGWGTDHFGVGTCKMHFGSTGSHRTKAKREIALGQLGQLLTEVGVEDDDHIAGLREGIRRARTMCRALDVLIAELDKPYGPNHLGDGAPHVLVAMQRDWTELAGRLMKSAVDVGLEERHLAGMERVADQLVSVVREFLSGLQRSLLDAGTPRETVLLVWEQSVPQLMAGAIDAVSVGDRG